MESISNFGRLIPLLVIKDGKLVKTKKFQYFKYLGDPINAIEIFSNFEADEVIVIDISDGLDDNSKIVTARRLSESALMPLSYGGGVNSIELCSDLFKVGYDKIIIRSKLSDKVFLDEITSKFGQQAVSGCFEIVYSGASGELSVNSKNMSLSYAVDYISKLANNFIGEVILNFRELEGTRLGLPYNLVIEKIEEAINSPIVITGGASSKDEALNYLKDHPRLSVAASSIFTLQKPNDAVLISY